MNETPELKPCPFCGEPVTEIVDATKFMGIFRIFHRCKVIGTFVVEGETAEEAAETWNTRA